MPENSNMWWKTRIESITVQADQSMRAIAQVLFESGTDTTGNYYDEEKGTMHFLQDNSATLISAHSSFNTGSETTWKLESAMENEVTNETTTRRTRRPRKCSMKARETKQSDRVVSRKRKLSKGIQKQKSQKQRSKRAKTEDVLCNSDSSLSDDYSTITNSPADKTETPIAIAVGNLSTLYSTLQKELSALQQKVNSMDRYRVLHSLRESTKEKRMYLKHELYRQQKRSLTLHSGETRFTFSSVLRRFPVEFSIDCSLQDFAIIAKDINGHIEEGVQYLPSLPTITAEAQPLCHKHVVFQNSDTLFEWLGINNSAARSQISKQIAKKKGKKILQLLGGVHWDIDNDQRSLHFFFKQSSSRALPRYKKEEEIQPVLEETSPITVSSSTVMSTNAVQNLTLSSTKWDDANGCFLNTFKITSSPSFFETINASNILDFDAFTLTWKPLKGLRSQDVYTNDDTQQSIVLGKLVLYIPAVLFYGDHLSKTVEDLLSE